MPGFTQYDGPREYAQQYPKTFIASKAFNNDFFTYTTSKNAALQTVGTLGFVTTDAARCPVGRVLHATGKKLYPNVNPMKTFPGGSSLLTSKKFLMAVYDPISQLNGFIDPSASIFAKYDQSLDNAFNLGPTANGRTYSAAQAANPLGGLAGKLTVGPDSGTLAMASGGTPGARGANSGQSVDAKNAVVGQATATYSNGYYYTVNTTACLSTSKVLLTTTLTSGDINQATISTVAAGYFIFYNQNSSSSVGAVNWMIIN